MSEAGKVFDLFQNLLMRDKTIAFIGDSLGLQQFNSLMCMVTSGVGGENLEFQHVGCEYGLVFPLGAFRPSGFAYRFPKTNTTILNYWSVNLCDLVPINDGSGDVAMHLDRPPAFITKFLHTFDVLVLNTGHHWNQLKFTENRWVMYVDGKPNEDKRIAEIANAKNFTIYSLVRWLDLQIVSHPGLKVFFRTLSPPHYLNGDWESGHGCENTVPLSNGSEVTRDGSMDQIVEGAVRGTKIKILDITALSQLRDEAHVSPSRFDRNRSDCLHWCLPGVPDTWNEILLAQI
ncbi:hypothetical protein PIB30_014152 [Stylosanthes scabra]|uniref:Trichome birefringence-like C-terminal domain-containing protein n=1 Tax=Stylosanthes scabra TaxID=79078 RepID=A0ABU6U8A5_9FABA|nr:hypothetical protein [Stylosanthes scabra]